MGVMRPVYSFWTQGVRLQIRRSKGLSQEFGYPENTSMNRVVQHTEVVEVIAGS
jgi:hypothetical protein